MAALHIHLYFDLTIQYLGIGPKHTLNKNAKTYAQLKIIWNSRNRKQLRLRGW